MMNHDQLLRTTSVLFFTFLLQFSLNASAQSAPSCNPFLSTVKTIFFSETEKLPKKSLNVSFYPYRNWKVGSWGAAKAEVTYVVGQANAPLVIIMVGLGSPSTVGYARYLMGHLYKKGYSVISLPSTFHMKSSLAFSRYMRPGLASQDSEDLYQLMTAAAGKIIAQHHLHPSKKVLMGVSMGGFHAAALMAHPEYEKEFNQAVLINPPLDLPYGMAMLDHLSTGKGQLSEEQKKVIVDQMTPFLDESNQEIDSKDLEKTLTKNHFGEKELGFFIGMKMKLSVQDIIFASQQIQDNNVLKSKKMTARYLESHTWSIVDYLQKIAWPFYDNLLGTPEAAIDLQSELSIWKSLKNISRPKDFLLLHAYDDFISHPQSLSALKKFPFKVVLSQCGGHVGALTYPVYLNPLDTFLK